jgi:hypothetical protein
MPKNQLFKINPDIHIVNDLLSAFGLEDLEDLPCKKKSLDNLSEKRIITILRQFIKGFGYKCIGSEQSVKGKKTMKYQLIVMEREELSPSLAKREYVLSFD